MGPVSIRCRRVRSPLLHEWGPKGAPSELGDEFFFVQDAQVL
jgi:hypothetical protein